MATKSLNKVMLLGRLGRDPEVKYTGSGKAVATFTMATSQSWKDQSGEWKEKTEWHNIIAWGRLGEICGEYLTKGSQAYVEGRLQTREWENRDGNKRTITEIVANDLIMLGSRQGNQGNARSRSEQTRERSEHSQPDYIPPENEVPF